MKEREEKKRTFVVIAGRRNQRKRAPNRDKETKQENLFFGCFKSLHRVDDRRKKKTQKTEERNGVCVAFFG